MDQLISSWATRYGASVFYNYIVKENYTECILVIVYKDDIITFRGSSKTFGKIVNDLKSRTVAKLLAQTSALNGYITEVIESTSTEEEEILDTISHDILEILEDHDFDEE